VVTAALLAVALLGGLAGPAGGAGHAKHQVGLPGPLTREFPLGSQRLCCRSSSSTSASAASTTSSATTRGFAPPAHPDQGAGQPAAEAGGPSTTWIAIVAAICVSAIGGLLLLGTQRREEASAAGVWLLRGTRRPRSRGDPRGGALRAPAIITLRGRASRPRVGLRIAPARSSRTGRRVGARYGRPRRRAYWMVAPEPTQAIPPAHTGLATAGLSIAAVIAAATVLPGRELLVLAGMLVLPGAAVLAWFELEDPLIWAALALAISIAVAIVGGLVLVETGFWHPVGLAVAVGLASTALLLAGRRLRPRRGWNAAPARMRLILSDRALLTSLLPLVLGLGCWGVAVAALRPVMARASDVPGVLPLAWWLSLALLLGGAVRAVSAHEQRGWVVALYVAALTVVLYGTAAAVLPEPEYTWSYKHIGVVRLIELRGHLTPGLDIYNRWPGFFAAAAIFSTLTGVNDPVSYAAWSEPLFALLDALMVGALAWSMVRDRRVAGLAALIFTLGNWIGQNYFSPQAAAFPLALGLLLVVSRHFMAGSVAPRLCSVIEWAVRRPQLSYPPRGARRVFSVRGAPIGVVLLLDCAIVVTHQLTPYFVLLQLAAVALAGPLRPRWILVASAAITIGYLVPNLGFVNEHFGLFSSLDPFANAHAAASAGHPSNEPWINQHAGQLLALLFAAAAAIAAAALARRGLGLRVTPLVALAVAPVLLLFGQDYGGEASLRTFLFSAPWDAMLIAWWVVELAVGPRSLAAGALVVCAVVVALFVPAFFGQTSVNSVSPGEVAASQYFYAHAPAGSVLVTGAPNFPLRSGARYALMPGSQNDAAPSLLSDADLRYRPLGARDIPAVISLLRSYGRRSFLVFSNGQQRYASAYGLAPPGSLARLEHAVADAPQFALWHADPGARIYTLLPPSRSRVSSTPVATR
jgi:hypothetical protein